MSLLSTLFNPSSGIAHNAGNRIQAPAPVAAPAATSTPAGASATPGDGAAASATPATPASPLDQFAEMWQTPTTADGKPVAPVADPLKTPLLNFDPAAIQASAAKMDFTGNLDPALATKALGGDAAALGDLINGAIRQAVVGITLSQGNLVNNALLANNDRVTQALPKHIKSVQLMETPNENPVLDHPAAQPLVAALKRMAFEKDPSASPAAVSKMVADYLTNFGTALHENSPAAIAARTTAAKTAGESDWSNFMQ